MGMRILAGDIGATHTRLALFEGHRCLKEQNTLSRDHPSLSAAVQAFNEPFERACFGVPGPVRGGRCRATNLPWVVDAAALAAELHIDKVWLLNDLEASAHGLSFSTFETLNEGVSEPASRALIAAGTGLGEAGLYWDGKTHHPFACEGGHADFAPRDDREVELFLHLRQKYGHVSYERVLSGPGLYELYRFLEPGGRPTLTSPEAVTEGALQKTNKAAVHALEWFVSLYGSEAGNLALKFLALGGVYIGGGIAPHMLSVMKSGLFMEAFVAKGRFSSLLARIPVHVIMNDNAALLGAAHYAYGK